MTELQQLIAMLTRAGIGHGTRQDYKDGKPSGEAVQMEDETGFAVAEFAFDNDGKLLSVHSYEGQGG